MRNRGEIILARHGRPRLRDVSPITGDQLGSWVRRYNECGINREILPPGELRQLAASAGCILSSDLPRAIESAAWLSSTVEIEPELREAGLPDTIGIPVRLPPHLCVVVARAMWLVNWSKSSETLAMTRERANRVADRLCDRAGTQHSVLVVGHGMFNRFIAACLRKRDWSGPRNLPRTYWSTARFVLNR
jgi:broad specificity phosphatase PhoE